MIGQGYCVLCGCEVLDPTVVGNEDCTEPLGVVITARGTGASRVEWAGDAHPDCVGHLWVALRHGQVVEPPDDVPLTTPGGTA